MKNPFRLPVLFALLAAVNLIHAADIPRVLVLTDIEADPDDTQSLVRLLLYSNEIDIEGIVATTSTWMRTAVHPESIHAVIDAYGKVHDNLAQHAKGYPKAETLHDLVRAHLPVYGMEGVGKGKSTAGSDWIIQALEKDDDRPLWISVWGGPSALAQALYTLRATRPASEVERLVSKLRVYTISDQDDSGPWLRREFPGLFYIVTPGGDGSYGTATWTAVNAVIEGIDNTTISNPWLAENIQQGHGPLGAVYPDTSWGMEGDTPAFLGLIPNGLNVPERPDYGGWGGRYERKQPTIPVDDPSTFLGGAPIPQETRPIWTNAIDTVVLPVKPEYGRTIRPGEQTFTGFRETLWRWRDDFQHDFAARMDWTTQSFAEANHPPVPVLSHPAEFSVKSGEGISLNARGSHDPDGDSLTYYWFNYAEAGSYGEPVSVGQPENAATRWIQAPEVDEPVTLHFILRLTDKGSPALSRYQRVVVTVEP